MGIELLATGYGLGWVGRFTVKFMFIKDIIARCEFRSPGSKSEHYLESASPLQMIGTGSKIQNTFYGYTNNILKSAII